jgi:AcrR family transcriptional regulator
MGDVSAGNHQRQADETRTRIAEAARKLILGPGYGAATMEAIAREAGVATPTVYAVFGSKRNILAELIDRAAFGPAYQDLVGEALALADPVARLRMAPRIARQIYDAERSEIQLLREAGSSFRSWRPSNRKRNAAGTGPKALPSPFSSNPPGSPLG